MGKSLTYKILEKHLRTGTLEPGNEIGITIDQTLTQDATGTMAYLQFEALQLDKVKTELSVSYVDHNTLQEGFENADDHRYLKSIASKCGIYFSKPGNGICHQVHLERFGKPGRTMLGSDSHTPTGGGIGMLSIGAGGLDVAVAMGGGPFYLIAPSVIKINLTNKLRKWVSAKDVILHVLGILSTKGNVNQVIEYTGEGVRSLSVPERATITNMGAETGVTTSVFPSDDITREFLKAQDRETDWTELTADPDATYQKIIEIDLAQVRPMCAKPHSPGNVVPVSEIQGMKVHQVGIGSCTNSSLRDLTLVGEIFKNQKIHPDISCIIAPGSKQVFSMISKNHILTSMIEAGARIMESTCGFCIGMGQAPETDAVSVRTNNRNFEGRSGTRSAGIYITSPETAALTALKGSLTDPLSCPVDDYPLLEEVQKFDIDDSMILAPSADSTNIQIIRGPNIGDPPHNSPMANTLDGSILIKVEDKITTDHIMPAGSRLKYRSNIQKYAEFVFEQIDADFHKKALIIKNQNKAGFILAGESYGQGSSREHAALCPMYLGIKAVLAKSFERIHANNLVNFGILPLIFTNQNDYEQCSAEDEIILEDVPSKIKNGEDIILKNKNKGADIRMTYNLSPRQVEILIAGGLLNYTREQKDNK